jgi:hypothetical protein
MIASTLPLPESAPDTAALRDSIERRGSAILAAAARSADLPALNRALAAPNPLSSLAHLLLGAAAAPAARQQDPLADALLRGVGERARLIAAAGGLLSVNEVAALLGLTRQAVDKRRRAGQVLAMRAGSDWRYPAIQFGPEGAPPAGLAEVIAALAEAGPWATLDLLLAEDPALGGRSPLQALRAGDRAAVQRLLAARSADAFG